MSVLDLFVRAEDLLLVFEGRAMKVTVNPDLDTVNIEKVDVASVLTFDVSDDPAFECFVGNPPAFFWRLLNKMDTYDGLQFEFFDRPA